MDIDKLGQSLHSLERKILPFLRDHVTITEIAAKSKLKEDEINHALKWLESKGLIELKITSYETIRPPGTYCANRVDLQILCISRI